MKAILCAVLLSLAASPGIALAGPEEGKVTAYCNANTSEFFISAGDRAPQGWTGDTIRRKLDWGSLLKLGPEKNQWGDLLRAGSRTRVLRCGALAVTLSSGFVNQNPQGELGALDFAVVEIRWGRKTLLPPTALEQCELKLTRYRYFGDCPDRWAQDIEVRPAGRAVEVRVRRVYLDDNYDEVEKVDVLR